MTQINPASVRTERTEVTATPSTKEVESTVADPYAGRRVGMDKLQQALYLLFAVIGALLAVRLVLRVFGADPSAPFVSAVYGVTAPLVAPFVGIFGPGPVGGNVLEIHSLVALGVYALLAWLLVKLAWLLFGETRSAMTSTTRTTKTRVP